MKTRETLSSVQKKVNATFISAFGRTPLRQRMEDILKEAIEFSRYVDLKNLKEEAGDILSSVLQLCNENDWRAEELILATLDKIKRRKLQYKSLGRKTSVGILGLSGNPPTNGHIKLAQFVLNTSKVIDQIWLTPCFGHMYDKHMATPEQRLEMCRIAASVDGRIKVCDYEIVHQLRGETYHFLKQLMEEDFAKDKYDFSYIIGLDNANTFDKWVNYEDLERMMRFIVVGRLGVDRDEKVNWYLKPPHIYLCPDKKDIPKISSTWARDTFKAYWDHPEMDCQGLCESISSLMNVDVTNYILKNGLYMG